MMHACLALVCGAPARVRPRRTLARQTPPASAWQGAHLDQAESQSFPGPPLPPPALPPSARTRSAARPCANPHGSCPSRCATCMHRTTRTGAGKNTHAPCFKRWRLGDDAPPITTDAPSSGLCQVGAPASAATCCQCSAATPAAVPPSARLAARRRVLQGRPLLRPLPLLCAARYAGCSCCLLVVPEAWSVPSSPTPVSVFARQGFAPPPAVLVWVWQAARALWACMGAFALQLECAPNAPCGWLARVKRASSKRMGLAPSSPDVKPAPSLAPQWFGSVGRCPAWSGAWPTPPAVQGGNAALSPETMTRAALPPLLPAALQPVLFTKPSLCCKQQPGPGRRGTSPRAAGSGADEAPACPRRPTSGPGVIGAHKEDKGSHRELQWHNLPAALSCTLPRCEAHAHLQADRSTTRSLASWFFSVVVAYVGVHAMPGGGHCRAGWRRAHDDT